MTLTKEECQELAEKIDSEGFDYYFTTYGADRRLDDLFGAEIEEYIAARNTLASYLIKYGIEVEL